MRLTDIQHHLSLTSKCTVMHRKHVTVFDGSKIFISYWACIVIKELTVNGSYVTVCVDGVH